MGKKKGAPPPTQEELDIEQYRLTADLAVSDAEELRKLAAAQQQQLEAASSSQALQKEEAEELYEYLDAQMLSTARDRQSNEAALHDFQIESQRKIAALQHQLEQKEQSAAAEIAQLKGQLETAHDELRALRDFRGVRPQMEAEMKALRQAIQDEKDERRRAEHRLQVDLWRQREALNVQMMERLKQAKTNFLDITAEMLDSTVHRTMLDNQNLGDELALQSSRIEWLMAENGKLTGERDELKRDVSLRQQAEVSEVKRSLARRKLASTATAQHDSLSQVSSPLTLPLTLPPNPTPGVCSPQSSHLLTTSHTLSLTLSHTAPSRRSSHSHKKRLSSAPSEPTFKKRPSRSYLSSWVLHSARRQLSCLASPSSSV